MKLIFTKDEEHQVAVAQENEGQRHNFSYVEMIRGLLDEGPMEPPELNGDFTASENKSINRMVGFINEVIDSTSEAKEEESGEDILN